MSLAQLESVLLWASAAMAVIVVLTIVIYYWYSRKSRNNYLENHEIELRYFIQKQVDFRGATTGYECLLRQHNWDDSWTLPQKLDSLPLQRVIFLLTDTFKSLPEEPITLSINLEFDQITSPDFRYFVRWALSRIAPMKLAVEYTVGPDQPRHKRGVFRRRIREARTYGMQFGIDNVGSSLNNLKNIEWILPEVDSLKCSMRSFRKTDPNEWLDLNLQFWNRLSQQNHIELILMGIENEADQQLADQLKIKTRQGYLFSRPVNPHEGSRHG
ncbi:MAG TPA: EAL domain-containing protein [Levilactobacillus hammesii]|uniref:EAL domain-containing protein n=1 Tax=Levilactobacillus hammesii TaxID=267633 RepID=A0A921JXA3_9LACO|nr:EAL domain-containing protein [Levilactobacillus hammesii]